MAAAGGAAAPAFIVLEGLDGVGKSTTAEALAAALGAALLCTPPPELAPFRPYIDARPALRPGYYATGNVLAAAAAAEALRAGRHVVLDRFHASTIAYALARGSETLPPAGDAAYTWPAELLRPAHMLQLVLPEAARVARRASRSAVAETQEEAALRKSEALAGRVREAFGRLGCVEVSAEGSRQEVLERVLAACGHASAPPTAAV